METQVRIWCSWSAYMTSQWIITQFTVVLMIMVTWSICEHGTTEINLCEMKKDYNRVVSIIKQRDRDFSIKRCHCYITSKSNWKMTIDVALPVTSSNCNEVVRAYRNNTNVYERCSNIRNNSAWSNEVLLNEANDSVWFEYSRRESKVFRETASIQARVVTLSAEQVSVVCNPGLPIDPRSGGPREPRGSLPPETPSTSTKSLATLTPKSGGRDVDDDSSESRLYLIIGITSALCFVGFTMAVVVGVRHKCGMRRGQDGIQITAGHIVDNTYTGSSRTYEELNEALANSVATESYISPSLPPHTYVNTNGEVIGDRSSSQLAAHAYINMQIDQPIGVQSESGNQLNGYVNLPAEHRKSGAGVVCPNCNTVRAVSRHPTVEA